MTGLLGNCTTEPDTFRRQEVSSGWRCARHWPRSAKAQDVVESYAPGAGAIAVVVRHGLHRDKIFARQCRLHNHAVRIDRAMPKFIPVILALTETDPAVMGGSSRVGVIAAGLTIRLGGGCSRYRVRDDTIAVPDRCNHLVAIAVPSLSIRLQFK